MDIEWILIAVFLLWVVTPAKLFLIVIAVLAIFGQFFIALAALAGFFIKVFLGGNKREE